MARIAQGRTVFLIAHRLSTVRRSHRIITIDRGRLVEDGTHEELVNKGGRYAALYRLQAGMSKPTKTKSPRDGLFRIANKIKN